MIIQKLIVQSKIYHIASSIPPKYIPKEESPKSQRIKILIDTIPNIFVFNCIFPIPDKIQKLKFAKIPKIWKQLKIRSKFPDTQNFSQKRKCEISFENVISIKEKARAKILK